MFFSNVTCAIDTMSYLGHMTGPEFDALVYSFGDQLVGHIGRDSLRTLLVRPHAGSETADVLIGLQRNTWDEQLRAMELIDEVRNLFLGELSFEFRFLADDDVEPSSRAPEAAEYRQIVAA